MDSLKKKNESFNEMINKKIFILEEQILLKSTELSSLEQKISDLSNRKLNLDMIISNLKSSKILITDLNEHTFMNIKCSEKKIELIMNKNIVLKLKMKLVKKNNFITSLNLEGVISKEDRLKEKLESIQMSIKIQKEKIQHSNNLLKEFEQKKRDAAILANKEAEYNKESSDKFLKLKNEAPWVVSQYLSIRSPDLSIRLSNLVNIISDDMYEYEIINISKCSEKFETAIKNGKVKIDQERIQKLQKTEDQRKQDIKESTEKSRVLNSKLNETIEKHDTRLKNNQDKEKKKRRKNCRNKKKTTC